MKKAIHIPTYNRAEVVKELLDRYQKVYTSLGFDLFIDDSSTDDSTLNLICDYIDDGRIVYNRIPSEIHSNLKVYSIYREFANSDYDYIWVQSDSIRWNLEIVSLITEKIDMNEFDLIIPNYRDEENIGDKVYTDVNTLFEDCAWHMTLYGATIVRKNVLQDIDWTDLEAKYCVPEKINFSHVGLYFEQIAKMDRFKAIHLGLPQYSLTSTILKKASGWRKNSLFIHCECWPAVIETLPPVYEKKTKVIKKQGYLCGDLTTEGLKIFRAEGILNPKAFIKYAGRWNKVSDISILSFFGFCVLPRCIAAATLHDRKNEKRMKKKIGDFCRQYDCIYIYGCGQKADTFAGYLEEMNIHYNGFLVSTGQNEKKSFREKPVTEISSGILRDSRNGIIFALNELNYSQAMKSLPETEIRAGLFSGFDTENS